MKERNIVVCILLSFLTCGIYGIIWFVGLTNDAARANNDNDFNGLKAVLFTIITCGIYEIYWHYKMGKEIYEAKTSRNMAGGDNSVLYLILRLVGLGIVGYCLMQNELNDLGRLSNNGVNA